MSKYITDELFEKLNEFIKKYHQNQLIKGGIYVLSLLIIFFLLFAIIEHLSSLDVRGRTFLFWTYILSNLIIFTKLIVIPTLRLFKIGKAINYKDAAKIIGKHFPEIDDKLINVLELSEISKKDNALIAASIQQKTKKLSAFSFKNAIDFSLNKRHLKWVITPITILLLFIISGKEYILTESSARIIKHNTFFEPKAPFRYIILNSNLSCKQFSDFTLKIRVEGNEIPAEIFIMWGQNKFKMTSLKNYEFEYKFSRVHSDLKFQLYGGGYASKNYIVKCLLQPRVVDMKINVIHPKYTKKKKAKIENNGDIIVSEGSVVKWSVQLENTDSCFFIMDGKTIITSSLNKLSLKKQIFKKNHYKIVSSNNNKLIDTLTYSINVIPDEFPKIQLTQSYDTASRTFFFSGVIEDDYCLNKLEFIYTQTQKDSIVQTTEEIPIQKKSSEQFLYSTNFEKLKLKPGEKINYFFKVWDNDEINGSKFTLSQKFSYKELSTEDLIRQKDYQNKKTKSSLNKSLLLSKEIQKKIQKLNETIIEKKQLDWQEKQKIEEILKKQNELEKQIKNTQKYNSENLKNQKKLDSSILKKQKQLDELMNNILDDETKRLLEEMSQIMDEAEREKLKELLERLNSENLDLEKELDRELELFKQLEFEQKIEEVIDKIYELKKEQEGLKQKTKNKNTNNEDLAKLQEEINKKMSDLKQDLKDLRQKNMALENKKTIPKTESIEENIIENMQKSQTDLEKKQKGKSMKSQQNAIDKLDELKQKLDNVRKTQDEQKPVEDMETLRKILENLITLSFDQEDLINDVKNTPRNSPEFITLVQQQNKLSENSKIIEDSLFALSKRVLQIQSSINKEISSIKSNMNKATSELEARDVNNGTKRQQLVMTSCNNLALLLSEILEQMQKDLELQSSECNKPKNCNKPSSKSNKPSMSEIKKAQKKLNEEIKRGKRSSKKSNKQCEKQSKGLMRLAKQQEQIRRQLLELRDEIGKNGEKGKIDKIVEKMEENERDIINDKITNETINRQKDIFNRLLEAENSNREQGEENKRESNESTIIQKNSNKVFLKYQKQKNAHEELLKTTPVQLTPFYKKKVNNYFNYIIND